MNQQQIPAPENPRLKAALREIEEVMHRHDVAGVCVLQVPTHCQFYVKFDPSHSLAYMKGKTFSVKTPIIPVDPEERQAYQLKVANTLNMLVNLQLMCGNIMATLGLAADKVREVFHLAPPGPGRNGQMPKKK